MRALFLVTVLTTTIHAQSSPLFYSEDSSGVLWSLDPATGAATMIGMSGVTGSTNGLAKGPTATTLYGTQPFGLLEVMQSGGAGAVIGSQGMEALAFDGTDIYACINGSCFTVDPVTGAQATIIAAPGGDVEGLAFAGGTTIYGVNSSSNMLQSYDTATNMWTTIGATGQTIDNCGLAFAPTNVLYMKCSTSPNLFTVDPATGLATVVGTTGITVGGGLAWGGPPPPPSCTLDAPMTLPAFGDITLAFDLTVSAAATADVTFEYSLDMGMTWNSCTPAAGSPLANPAMAVMPGMTSFVWDSAADAVGATMLQVGVLVRATADDLVSAMPGQCMTMAFDVENIPPPTCMVATPASPARRGITLSIDATTTAAAALDALVEFSTDAGATWLGCAPDATSMFANPIMGQPSGMFDFIWDSDADMVGPMGVQPGVLVRVTVSDAAAIRDGECQTMPFDVDNSALCGGICGDCDLGGVGPDVIDALTAAQISAGLITPMGDQIGCCDVNSDMTITVLDALIMAQAAAGLPGTLICP